MSCPICEKRRAERFCPAKAEKICAVCCGKEREVTITCPTDCAYLISAHRYEREHPRDIPAERKILVHINNSNPILVDDSAERDLLVEEGWEVAYDGMEVSP